MKKVTYEVMYEPVSDINREDKELYLNLSENDPFNKFINYLHDNNIMLESDDECIIVIGDVVHHNVSYYPKDSSGLIGMHGIINFSLDVDE